MIKKSESRLKRREIMNKKMGKINLKLMSLAVLSLGMLLINANFVFAADDSACNVMGGTCAPAPCISGVPIGGKCLSQQSAASGYTCCAPDPNTTNPGRGDNVINTGSGPGNITVISIPNPLGSGVNSFQDLIEQRLIPWLIWAGGIVSFVMILWGAFQLMTAGASGKEDDFIKGRKTIIWAIGGYAVLLLASSLIAIIANLLGAQ